MVDCSKPKNRLKRFQLWLREKSHKYFRMKGAKTL